MSVATLQEEVVYEDDNGEPMSENTLQFEWIVTLKGGLEALFRADPNVFVAGDLLWYPLEGQPKVRAAPDALVALGRPKGYRGSYKQWEEGGVAPHVVFEVLSPGNRPAEMAKKLLFYEAHGVQEYYVYDPENVTLAGNVRDSSGFFLRVPRMSGHISPLLGIRFELAEELVVYRPDGTRFLTYVELVEQSEEQQLEVTRERQSAERERQTAAKATAALEALRAKLRAAGIDPDAV